MRLCPLELAAAISLLFFALAGDTSASPTAQSLRTVILDYATYEGYYNGTYDLNIWKGIRYAAPPVGDLRWQAPRPPSVNNTHVTPAVNQPPLCPQTGGFGLPEIYGFNTAIGNEDCLFLNVYAAPNASALPVVVWIHGGGNSVFGALYDPSVWMNTNANGFIVVEIQYRLGAFGFLASPDIKAHGKLNAGLLDQRYALEWVQKHITKFGGDPRRVTIAGESSGASSVMYHALAYGGKSTSLFTNIIAASPWTPPVYGYNDTIPRANYDTFVELAGCTDHHTELKRHPSVFACLVAADSEVLQNASGTVSTTRGYFGSFAFSPVVDGDYIRKRPSKQLELGRVAGKRILVGNNANEGVPLTNPRVSTREAYDSFVAATFPHLSPADLNVLNSVYQIDQAEPGNMDVRFDTLGNRGPTALAVSEMATGIQQTVFNIAAEYLYDCPAQWLAEAFSQQSRAAWKYQYSVTPAYHGADLPAYFAVGTKTPNEDFRSTFQKIWGHFIMHDSPLITVKEATAGKPNATVPVGCRGRLHWPAYSPSWPYQMDLNTTGGDVTSITVTPDLSYYERIGAGIVNNFRLVDARKWEGGRGHRCDFWRSVSQKIPQ